MDSRLTPAIKRPQLSQPMAGAANPEPATLAGFSWASGPACLRFTGAAQFSAEAWGLNSREQRLYSRREH